MKNSKLINVIITVDVVVLMLFMTFAYPKVVNEDAKKGIEKIEAIEKSLGLQELK